MRISDWSSDVCSSDLRHPGIADGKAVAGDNRRLDAGDLEEDATVALGRHYVDVMHAAFGVVLVRARQFAVVGGGDQIEIAIDLRSEEHTSELQSLMRIS